ncbi:MAG: family N-acetyltransferase [Frankiales bacterium]|nr:family N-acetyltransferase [Frankiales bacterium]
MTLVRTGTGLDEDAAVAVWQAAQADRGRRSGGTRTQRVRASLRSRDALLLVAERDDAVVGVLLAGLARDDDGRLVPGLLEVSLLAVVPRAQRSGAGRALLDGLLARYPRVAAWVDPDDLPALGVLGAAGLRPTGRTRPGAVHLASANGLPGP